MMKPICKSLVGQLRLNLNEYLMTERPSTGFCPHFSTTCDKSTPGRETNQAIMLQVIHRGKRLAIPVGSPTVYTTSNDESMAIDGGSGYELGSQVLSTLLDYALLDPKSLSFHMGKAILCLFFDND